jgi:phosphate transport system substrate-binding protein
MYRKLSGKILSMVAIAGLTIAMLAGCGGTETTESDGLSGEIKVIGSDTVLPVAQMTAEMFMEANPDAIISVTGGGSGVGIAALIDGTTNIANASRGIKDKEIEEAEAKGITPNEIKIADDGLSVIVNPELGLESLTIAQIKDIFTGKVSNWKEVGGPDLQIVAITRDNSSGTYAFFKEEVLDDEDFRADALTEPSNGNIVKNVSQTKGAIGYVGLAYLNDSVVSLSVAKEDGAALVAPSLETVKDGTYPIARPLFMYTNGEPTGLVKAYIDFVLSAEGQAIVTEIGFIPVN